VGAGNTPTESALTRVARHALTPWITVAVRSPAEADTEAVSVIVA
jgi:hypothetical protein